VSFVERSFDPGDPDSSSDRRFEFMIDGAHSPTGSGYRTKGHQR